MESWLYFSRVIHRTPIIPRREWAGTASMYHGDPWHAQPISDRAECTKEALFWQVYCKKKTIVGGGGRRRRLIHCTAQIPVEIHALYPTHEARSGGQARKRLRKLFDATMRFSWTLSRAAYIGTLRNAWHLRKPYSTTGFWAVLDIALAAVNNNNKRHLHHASYPGNFFSPLNCVTRAASKLKNKKIFLIVFKSAPKTLLACLQ